MWLLKKIIIKQKTDILRRFIKLKDFIIQK